MHAAALIVLLGTVSFTAIAQAEVVYSEPREPCADYDPLRQPFFGTTHLHTGLSFDASIRYVDQKFINPYTAYQFAKGTTRLPLPDALGIPGGTIPGLPGPTRRVQIDRPTDWGAVTDHSEHFGEMGICKNFMGLDAPGRLSFECRLLNGFYWGPSGASLVPPALSKQLSTAGSTNAFTVLSLMNDGPVSKMTTMPMCLNNEPTCSLAETAVWDEIQAAARDEYDKTSACTFTTFVAYENTSTPGGTNWHRNVIFRNDRVVTKPITAIDMAIEKNLRPTDGGLEGVGVPPSYFGGLAEFDAHPVVPGRFVSHPLPEILWNRIEDECLKGNDVTEGTGEYCDAVIIPHNSNVGGGVPPLIPAQWFTPFNRRDAERKAEFEPLVEIYQNKGSSECRWDPRFADRSVSNQLPRNQGDPAAGVETTDEFCAFELLDSTTIRTASGVGGVTESGPTPPEDFNPRSYVRNIWKDGLRLTARFEGVNPFKPGVVASSDSHNGTMGWHPEDETFTGHLGINDVWPVQTAEDIQNSSGGHSVVWAEENSRDAIFDALKRKETYGTSGPRIVVRFFGGWDYAEAREVCGGNIAQAGYEGGVPMGGDLHGRPPGATNPRFIVAAWRDDDPWSGRNLQQIQIVKGWVDHLWETHEEVLTVVGNAGNALRPQNRVDPNTCDPVTTRPNGRPLGSESLCTVWEDPDFDPNQHAFYYARVLEEPVCRYSTDWCQTWVGVNPLDGRRQCEEDLEALASSEDPLKKLRALEGAACCSDTRTAPIVQPAIQERAWTSPIWYTPTLIP